MSQPFDLVHAEKTASALARRCGRIALDAFSAGKNVSYKENGELVTETDPAIEKIIRAELHKTFPDHAIFGEECGRSGPDSDYVWHIDPIDGTTNFVTHIHHFNISLGLTCKNMPIVGVVYDPLHGELFSAHQNSGARLNGQPIRVSDKSDTQDAMLVIDYARLGVAAQPPLLLHTLFDRFNRVRVLGALAMDLCYVACGRLDLLLTLEYRPHKTMDVVGGLAILHEAGGVSLCTDGTAYSLEKTGLIAGGSDLAHKTLALIKTGNPSIP